MMGLLTKYQKEMNCLRKNDISGAIREIDNNQEIIEKAFLRREKELTYAGDLVEEIRKAKQKIRLVKEAPLLPGFTMNDLED